MGQHAYQVISSLKNLSTLEYMTTVMTMNYDISHTCYPHPHPFIPSKIQPCPTSQAVLWNSETALLWNLNQNCLREIIIGIMSVPFLQSKLP